MFDSPRLSGICGSDPRNLLTEAGRRRLEDAHWEADLIRKAALASLEFRYKSEADADVGFLEYLSTGQAYIDLKQADVQSARTVLTVAAEEYRAACGSFRQFAEAMEEEIQGATYSLELSKLQCEALRSEFIHRNLHPIQLEGKPQVSGPATGTPIRRDQPEDEDSTGIASIAEALRTREEQLHAALEKGPEKEAREAQKTPKAQSSITNIAAAKRVQEYIDQHGLNRAPFAEKAGIGVRTLYDLLTTFTASRRTWTDVATKGMEITAEELLATK